MRVFPELDYVKQPGACFQHSGFSPVLCGFLGFFVCSFLGQTADLTCFPVSVMVVSFKTSMIMGSVLLGSTLFCFLPM